MKEEIYEIHMNRLPTVVGYQGKLHLKGSS